MKNTLISLGFAGFRASGMHRLLAPWTRGLGAIAMFHHVRPQPAEAVQPNAELDVTPEFLGTTIETVRRAGFEIITLDHAIARISSRSAGKPFIVLTFDDGFRDVCDWALPILRRERAPMALFVTTGFAGRTASLWWIEAEQALRALARITLDEPGLKLDLPAATTAEKRAAGGVLMAALRAAPEAARIAAIAGLSAQAGLSSAAICQQLCLGWDELAAFAADDLVTIGAHTVSHPMLARLPEDVARDELVASKSELEARLGCPVHHLAYPVGERSAAGPREYTLAAAAGYRSAVTTRKGMVFAEHAAHLHALPRLSINGHYQDAAMLEILLSGAPFAAMNRGRRVNAD